MESLISKRIKSSIAVKKSLLADKKLLRTIEEVAGAIIRAFKDDKKLLLCGNGGSAADAQHLAAELAGRFYLDRKPLFAEALHVNTSFLTAVANDYSFEEVYSRLVEGKGRRGDILMGLSTSGNSKNVIKALNMAKRKGLLTVGLTGKSGGKMKGICDHIIKVPSSDTPRIQECHIMIGHIICEIVEKALAHH
jgi:D-sedoheptulose 7-phosphate isomerase